MSVSDAEYQAWLKDDNQERAVLVEAKYYDTSEKVRYLSTHSFVSLPTDTPANTVYDDLISNVPSLQSQISMKFGVGDIDLVNDGSLDAWLDDAWDGRELSLLIGDPAWARDDFRQIGALITEAFEIVNNNKMRLRVRDKREKLNINTQNNYYTSGEAFGKPIPLTVGQVFNITPVLINASTHQYQVHDGQINAITEVRDNGVSVSFTANLSAGTFVLSSQPSGVITCDVQGAKPSGTYHVKTADIVEYLVKREALVSADLDAASFTAFNTKVPYIVGHYMPGRVNLISVIDEITLSSGSYWLFNRSGKMILWQLDNVTGTAVESFDADDVLDDTFSFINSDLPYARSAIGYQKNYTVQNNAAGSVSEANRNIYSGNNLISAAVNSSIITAHPLALKPDALNSAISLIADANTEAARVLALRNIVRFVYEATFSTGPFEIQLGDEISVIYPRFGFENGKNVIVVGLDERPASNKIKVRFFL
tara:strand:+ start:358 stop:1800 length:1443 start_codon:yes stop_codon:yes gene_type:complete